MIEQLIETNRLYNYRINDGGLGICMANSEVEAINKVKESYLKHGYCASELTEIQVILIQKAGLYFGDDVLELFDI